MARLLSGRFTLAGRHIGTTEASNSAVSDR